MGIDLLGIWDGTYYTDGLWYMPGLFDLNGSYAGDEGVGGPEETKSVTLNIKWQGRFDRFYYALEVSPFYGELAGAQEGSIPVSGFVNRQGFIKIALYSDAVPVAAYVHQSMQDWSFNSFIKTHGGIHIMSGKWAITSWSEGVLSYMLGTLSVSRKLSLADRASNLFDSLGAMLQVK